MLEFVFAPHAITRHGEWVTPLTAAQHSTAQHSTARLRYLVL